MLCVNVKQYFPGKEEECVSQETKVPFLTKINKLVFTDWECNFSLMFNEIQYFMSQRSNIFLAKRKNVWVKAFLILTRHGGIFYIDSTDRQTWTLIPISNTRTSLKSRYSYFDFLRVAGSPGCLHYLLIFLQISYSLEGK